MSCFLCDIYKLTVKNLVDSPKHPAKELFWREIAVVYRVAVYSFIVLCFDLCLCFAACFGVINDGWIGSFVIPQQEAWAMESYITATGNTAIISELRLADRRGPSIP